MKKLHILHIEPNLTEATLVQGSLVEQFKQDLVYERVSTWEEAVAAFEKKSFSTVFFGEGQQPSSEHLRRLRRFTEGALNSRDEVAELIHELEVKEQELSSIFENIPNMIFVKDGKELRFVRMNRAGEELLGYERKDLLGKNDYDFFPSEQADFFTHKDREVFERKGEVVVFEEPISTRYKGTRYLRTRKVPVFDEKGAPKFLVGISEDITDQVRNRAEKERLEKALLETNERWKLGLKAAKIGIWDWDIENDLLTWDDEMYRLYGRNPEEKELAYIAWKQGLLPEEMESAEEEVRLALTGKKAFDTRFKIKTPSGEIRTLKAMAEVYRDERGRPIRMTGANIDITETEKIWKMRGEVERAKFLRLFLDATQEYALFMINPGGGIETWNTGALNLTGYNETEALGKSGSILFPATDSSFSKHLEEALHRGNFEENGNCVRKDGTQFMANVIFSPMKDEDKKLIGFAVVMRDLTEKSRLSEERAKFFSLAESSQEFIEIYDLNFRPIYVNSAALSLVGLDGVSAALNTNITDYFFPEDVDYFKNTFVPGVMVEGRKETEIRFRHFKTGEPIWMLFNLFGIKNQAGEFIGWATVSRNIHERKVAEKKLQEANDELVRSNSELEQFAYVASHDLQAPLRHISSFIQLLFEKFKPHEDPESKEWVSFVTDAVKHMEKLIHDLLIYSRVKRSSVRIENINLNKLVLRVIDLGVFGTEPVECKVHPLPLVRGSETQLQQLFQNLLQNASKFKREGEVAKIEVGAKQEEGSWVIFVKDHGIGIDKKYNEKLFKVFQRLHPKGKYSGTGIGLSICKKVVELHGGKIWVESAPNEGATFLFTLKDIVGLMPANDGSSGTGLTQEHQVREHYLTS